MERKAKQLGIKLSYVRNGKRYRKTDKQLYNAINGKLKVMAFGTGGRDGLEILAQKIANAAGKHANVDSVKNAKTLALHEPYDVENFIEALRILYNIEGASTHRGQKTTTPKDQALMNVINDFLEQTGMDLVERTDKVLEVSERIDAADVKDLFFREEHNPDDVKKIVSFVIYTMPGLFSDVQKYAENLNIT